MPEVNKNNFSKLCKEKGEALSRNLKKQILEQEFMRKSKFPIIYASEIILQYNANKISFSKMKDIEEFVQKLFHSSISKESIMGTVAFVKNHVKTVDNLSSEQEKNLEGYVIAVDSFTLVRIDYRIWVRKEKEDYVFVAAGIRGVLDVKKVEWNEFHKAYIKILNLGFPKEIVKDEKQEQIIKCVEKAHRLFQFFQGERKKEIFNFC